MFQHILVVCTGNICRSPVGEGLLQQYLPGRCISSAGLGALVGLGVEPTARQLAEAEGLDVATHRARQLSTEMLQAAELILVMTMGQRQAVADMTPQALGKTMLFGRWLDDGKGREIPDPYNNSRQVFEHVHQLLRDAAASWAAKL